MIFRQKSDSFYTFFKIIDAFPKVLDFSTMNFRIYSKKFGGIQKFCIWVFLINYTILNKKLDCHVRIWDKYSKVFERFLKFQTATTKKKELIHHIFGRSLQVFFRQNSDNFYTLLKFLDNFPNFLDFVTIKFRWRSKKLGRFPQFSRTFFSKFSKANPKTNKQK